MAVPIEQRTDSASTPAPAWRRFLPLALTGFAMGLFWSLDLDRFLSFEAILAHRDALRSFVAAHAVLAGCVFVLAYTFSVAISFPGASLLTVAGGFLFGTLPGGLLSVVSATAGAVIIYGVARTSFGGGLAARAGPFLSRFAAGFGRNAFLYLLSLRLAPIFPFWLVNLAPALIGVRLLDHLASTAIGILPATFAFAAIGSGLDGLVARKALDHQACLALGRQTCPFAVEASDLVTPELGLGLLALALAALVPVAVKAWKSRAA